MWRNPIRIVTWSLALLMLGLSAFSFGKRDPTTVVANAA